MARPGSRRARKPREARRRMVTMGIIDGRGVTMLDATEKTSCEEEKS